MTSNKIMIHNLKQILFEKTQQLKAKDQEIADLQAVIEKQGERIRYLEKQYRDLNPKGVNQ